MTTTGCFNNRMGEDPLEMSSPHSAHCSYGIRDSEESHIDHIKRERGRDSKPKQEYPDICTLQTREIKILKIIYHYS